MDDLISRREAIDELKERIIANGYSNVALVSELNRSIGYLMRLHSVQPEPQWIPVSERLPENGRQVLVYAMSTHFALAKYDEMREADGSYKKQWVTFDAWKPFYTVKNVIAWMPLPEPYRSERRTDDANDIT